MGRAKHCSDIEKNMAIRLRNLGKNISEIAKTLGRSRNMVLNAFKPQHTIEKRGRPKVTTVKMDAIIIRTAKKDPFMTSNAIKNELKLNCSTATIRRRLLKQNLRGCAAQKVPLLSKKNIKRRISFAKTHLANVEPEKWNNMIFSDETKLNLFGSDGRKYVRRPPCSSLSPRYTQKTVKHGGGSIMVWGAFSWYGPGPIYWIKETMTADVYVKILNDVLLPYAEESMPSNWVFQQDNDPKHTSKKAKSWFQLKNVQVLEWPAQSPDLNPIENLWRSLKLANSCKTYKNKEDLWVAVKDAWENIPVTTCQKLVESMDRRCKAVLQQKGYTTKY